MTIIKKISTVTVSFEILLNLLELRFDSFRLVLETNYQDFTSSLCDAQQIDNVIRFHGNASLPFLKSFNKY